MKRPPTELLNRWLSLKVARDRYEREMHDRDTMLARETRKLQKHYALLSPGEVDALLLGYTIGVRVKAER